MKAVLQPTGLETIPNVWDWIQYAEPARRTVEQLHPNLNPDDQWRALVEQNVLQQITNLRTHPWVADRTAAGRLQLQGWTYDLESGRVTGLQ